MKRRIVILGPAWPLRGGIAAFNERLAKAFMDEGHECIVISFSLQYPSFLFPGKSQYSDGPSPEGLTIYPWLNSINPLNWISTGRRLAGLKPDVVLVRFWLPLMGPALGTVLRVFKKKGESKIICLADNVVPHESRPGDVAFTRYFAKAPDAFIVMSEKVEKDLQLFAPHKPVKLVPHPLYDHFGEAVSKEAAREKLGLAKNEKWLLFFGFIRKYKGLDLLLRAMADNRIKAQAIKLLVAGEFYEDETPYRQIVAANGLERDVIFAAHFIPDADVKWYLCAADCVVQPYRSATQSGVTPLAYHFEKPMIVTDVGGLAAMVPHEKAGLVVTPDATALADAILKFYGLGEAHFAPYIKAEKQALSWQRMMEAILQLARL